MHFIFRYVIESPHHYLSFRLERIGIPESPQPLPVIPAEVPESPLQQELTLPGGDPCIRREIP